MAKYHENLKYHSDTLEKHKITEEEISFLKELQKEMNTQDDVGQADPRFWVIKGSEREYGIDSGYEDGAELIDDDCECIADTLEEAMEYIKDNLLDIINDKDKNHSRTITFDEIQKVIIINCHDNKSDEDYLMELSSIEEVADWLEEFGYKYRYAYYKVIPCIYPNTMFLTQKDAEEHLRANCYHYSDDAHTYAMTAWRSPTVNKLFKILQEVDWDNL